MFKTYDELIAYVCASYPEVTDKRIDNAHWDLLCPHRKVVRGFQVVKHEAFGQYIKPEYGPRYFKEDFYTARHYFRVTSVPNEGIEDINELPEEPPALRIAFRQVVRAMDANAHLAAAAMFRRALQVITRDLLKAKPGTLGSELNQVVGKQFNGGTITQNFGDNAYIVKEAGNQGAHPDRDPICSTSPQRMLKLFNASSWSW